MPEVIETTELIHISDPVPFAQEVWDTLSRIDVGDYIETKGDRVKLSYLSWTWAWAQLMTHYPESQYRFPEDTVHDDGTRTINCVVSVCRGKDQVNRHMWLPVMDHTNKAVTNPNARQISDTRMRCMVKCLSLFGLGLDVYAGSDLPIGSVEDYITPEQVDALTGLLTASGVDVTDPEDQGLLKFLGWAGVESVHEITKGKFGQARSLLEAKIRRSK
jgi:hypothetical protein